jgi:hypothetical protein
MQSEEPVMAETRTTTLAKWAPRSHATKPAAFPPHPALQSGGWYQASPLEAPGPGRPPVIPTTKKYAGLAVLLSVLFGPLGLCYLSMTGGLVATVFTVGVLGYSGSFLPLIVLWPVAVAVAAAWGSRR